MKRYKFIEKTADTQREFQEASICNWEAHKIRMEQKRREFLIKQVQAEANEEELIRLFIKCHCDYMKKDI